MVYYIIDLLYLNRFSVLRHNGGLLMKICICDDDKVFHDEIKKYLLPFFSDSNLPIIADCYSGEELVSQSTSSDHFDIVFLDIEMGDINGIEAAEEIRKFAPDTIVIFVSAHRNYVFDAFKCEALHYILKPIMQSDFDDVFNRALNKYRLNNQCFPIKWNFTRSNPKISDIMYMESYKRRLLIHTTQKTYDHMGKLTDAYEQLKSHGFIMVHQSYIVNMHYIKSFSKEEIILSDGQAVMVSVRKRAEALEMFDKYIQKWKW